MSIKCKLTVLKSWPSLSIRLRKTLKHSLRLLPKDMKTQLDIWIIFDVKPAGTPFVIYYNLDMRDVDVEFGFPVSVNLTGTNNIRPSQTPSGKSVTCLHLGPYIDIEPSYRALTEWI